MNGNWKGVLLVVVGLLLGSAATWIAASDRFVSTRQYERDRDEINRKLDLLLDFHLEDKRAGR